MSAKNPSTGHRLAVAEFFDRQAARYDRRYDRHNVAGYALRSRMDVVVRLVGDGAGEALDAGMGPGRLCVQLAERGWRVSGVDASREMVAVARTRMPETRSRLRCGRVEALPFADESFDVVTATGVLEYSNVPASLRELTRVLRPGGRAVVSYPNPHALYGIWKTRAWYPATRATKRTLRRPNPDMPQGAGEISPGRFEEALRRAGLEPVSRSAASYLTVPTPLDELLPQLTTALGRRLERTGRSAHLFATQIVYAALKPREDAL